MNKIIDQFLFDSLKAKDEPAPELNRRILDEWSKEDQTMKRSFFNKGAVAAACVCVLAAGSITAYAAYHFLNPVQIAQRLNKTSLSNAFESSGAIEINETQTSNGHSITLLGLVSGENLDEFVPTDKKSEINMKKSYAVFAIEPENGADMQDGNFCISPFVNGISFWELNNASIGASLTWFVQDGVLYELYSCDDLEKFADLGVYLGVVDQFGDETSAFLMDAQSGIYGKAENYDGTNALFKLPLDPSLADHEAVEKYLDDLRDTAKTEETDAPEDTMYASLGKFLESLTADELEKYFVKDTESVLTATPDQNGWIDFGSYYDSETGMKITGVSGDIEYMIEDDQDMRICSFGMSEEISSLQLVVLFRNGDGSFTSAVYHARENMEQLLKQDSQS